MAETQFDLGRVSGQVELILDLQRKQTEDIKALLDSDARRKGERGVVAVVAAITSAAMSFAIGYLGLSK